MQKLDLNILERSISQVFEERAICDGERLAIQFQNRSVTYNELNAWANRIARAIIEKRGVGAEPIALLFETGPEIVAAMLGVLKAGKFYIPLDISWPQARLNSIFEDSQTELILSDRRQFQATELGDRDVLWLDTLQPGISEENLKIQSSPDDLAYIIYTSGSSGKPKGVMQNHRYALNLYYTYSNIGEITKSDRFSLLYSVGFTGAVRDIYCSLLNGAALFPLDVKEIGLHQLGQWLEDNEITVMFAVATLFRHFAATLKGQGHFPKLRLIQIGSETVYRQDAELFEEHFSDRCRLIVFLGSTEISPVRQFSITKDTAIEGSTVPVGYGIEGTEVLLWDELGREVPTGEVGEIVVSSRQLALGYWRKPEVTEQVFVKKSDRRYFKTGDLGRFLPDGCLLHLGRKDFQVKIRGYRLETSEVEEALLSLESVKEAVVVAVTDEGGAPGDRLLVAYLTAFNSENKATVKELKEAVAERLPDYAIPACFIWLESLPLTATGKIDRRSLPKPEISLTSDLEIVPPRNATEERLVQIWSEVLNLEAIGVENNFFEWGGNSLHASRVLARISDKFNRELSLKTIFAAPTIAQLAKHLDSAKAKTSLPALVPTLNLRETKIPLSLAQQRLWFLDRLESNKAIYNLFRGFRLRGAIDVSSLEKAIQAIIERHEILRTTLEVVDGVPVQAIAPSLPFSLDISDLQDLPTTERRTKVEEITKEIQGWIFDLARPPLLKIVLIRLSERESKLLITMHHIISDDWSIQVFLKELSLLYKAFHQNSASPLRPLPVQYGDYTHWQLQYLAGEILEEQLDYWRSQLAGAPPLLDLPTDFPRSHSDAGFQSGIVPMKIDGETTEKLKALSRRSQTTLFVTLLTAFAVLLSRYSNQEDLVVGTAIANRNPAITEQLIGFFVSTLALRIQLPDNPTFLSILDCVGQTAIEAHAHADVPFDRLVEALQIQRHPNYSPIFQVMFILQNVTQETLAFPELETDRLDFLKPTAGATFDLTLSLTENNDGLVGTLEYNASLFARASIERMAGHFQRLIAAIAESPEMAIAQFPLLSAQEREQLLIEWNRTETDYPRHSCVHHLFETQVENTPNAIALVFGEQTLTYTELNEKANQLARYLQAQGVGLESLVGVCLERSPNLIVALLAILKAGAAYLPLDPIYPRERLSLMVKDAGLPAIIAEKDKSENLPRVDSCIYIYLDAVEAKIVGCSTENAIASTTATSLAYVMYTSGSTGQPKGVCVTHRNIVRLVKNTNYASFKPDDVFLQLASVSFDAATWEIWGSLLNGARLVLCPERQPSLTALGEILRQHRVTIILLISGLFHLTVDEGLEYLQYLRLLMAGGDVLSVTHVEKCFKELPSCQLINGYGPTENTTLTCCYPIDASILGSGTMKKSIPIGRPIANTRAYILDSQQRPVPIGVAGELYVGGDGVARGYLNRPELNAERFIPNPFVDGDRLYKTGDLARYLSDGNIEFLGRIDRQVKIRGFRIELGEIEAVLSQHPMVKQAMVIVHENSLGDKSLVAYAIAKERRQQELEAFLQQKLPDYMRPRAIVLLDEFPLTANGKIDRRALPLPKIEAERETEFVPPRTPTETVIAKIITEVLGRERVGIHDNFFALGGHSLLVIKVISRMGEKLGVELPVKSLFESPTVAELAEIMANSQEAIEADIIPAASEGQPLPLSFAQARLWFLNRLETAPNATYNVTVALEITGSLDVAALERSLQEIIRRHAILRTRISMVNGIPHQAIAPAKNFKLNLQTQESSPLERQRFLQERATAQAETPFDLERDDPVRVSLWQWSRENYALFLTLHHIVSDGRSMELLFEELSTLYAAFANGQASPLPELAIQYPDYAAWQRQRLTGEVMEKQVNYWKQQLAGISSPIDLPSDRPRPAVQTFRGGRVPFQLDATLCQRLRTLARANQSTLFMTLLAAFAVLLSRYSSQDDIPIGVPVTNRSHHRTESLIGFFVNTVVLRTRTEGNPSFQDLLLKVRQVALDAYSHQEVPFDKVVEALQPERSPSYSPLFQVMFTLETAPAYGELPGLTIAPIEWENKAAKFDLTLSIVEDADGLAGNWEYNLDLFDRETIARANRCWQTLLEGIVANPEMPVEQLPLLPSEERHRLLVEWNQTERDYPDRNVLELFAEQVRQRPEAIAILEGDRQISYGELDEQSDRLAGYLQSWGVGAETIVGICLERSPEIILGLWAILKAGGAYVPIDPASPPERVAYILQDTQLSILLTRSHLAANFSHPEVFIVDMDIDWQSLAPPAFLRVDLPGDRLAYIIYTSGSTGKPKGVEICHRSLANLVMGAIADYQITDSDRWLQFFSFSFDAAVEDIYPCLLSGGTLVLRNDEMLASSEQFWQQCREWQITVLNIPTAYWHLLAANLTSETRLPVGMRLVVIGGEAALPGSLAQWQDYMAERSEPPQLINAYGPTEATVTATLYPVTTVDSEALMLPAIPIGKPIGNAKVYVLDRLMQPVPVGVPGELYIGGAGLARGYLHRRELTAEKFVPNPFGEGRLYKSGDLVRYRSDGNLEFIGRLDNQVKLRGFRIELGEIEAILSQHPQVKQAIVKVREDHPGEKLLVAYALATKEGVSNAEVRNFMQQKLPHYMLPSIFVILDELPLTPTGKVDRRALPAPERELSDLNVELVAPRTSTEVKLVAIWAEVLERQQVGINDNFFELGGHSLLATQLMFRVREAFEIDISLRGLFDYPSISALAGAIDQILATGDYQSQALNLEAEAVLAQDIQPSTATVPTVSHLGRILLTGATGFLGSHLLYELLTTTDATVYCLIRADNLDAGWEKLKDKLKTSGLWSEDFSSRIVPIIGDLRTSCLGLSATQYNNLCQEIDAIYHVGAKVHHLWSYSQLKNANVLGIQEILRMASLAKIKPVHYVSTTSLFSTSDKPILESAIADCRHLLAVGYVQTKWVAEQLVWEAAKRGLPVKVYRISRVSGSSKTGVSNFDDLLSRFIKGCIQLKYFPTWESFEENLIPVDYTSKAIVYLSQKEDSFGKAFHLINPESVPLGDIFNWVRSLGYDLEEIDYTQWRSQLIEAPDNPLYPYLPNFPESLSGTKNAIEYDRSNVVEGLQGSGIELTYVNRELFKTYLSYFEKSRFL